MSIAPIVQMVIVPLPPERAFSLFTGSMGRWWKRGMTVGVKPHVNIIVEPRSFGRWFERDEDGAETDWGTVLAWEPPRRVLLGWQLDASFRFDPKMQTEVEVTFEPVAGGTKVTLVHRHLERFGESAERLFGQLSGGWPTLIQLYAELAKGTER